MEIIYLAAGKGSRLNKKTSLIPKCLVKVNDKSIIENNIAFLKKFKLINIIIGYKFKKIINLYKNYGFNFLNNKNYKNTNMVYSTFLTKPKQNKIIICYGDILFDHNIFNLIKKNKGNFLLVKKNWLSIWKKRMSLKKIFQDAEDIKIDNNNIIQSIGNKISKLPKYQYMGIICVEYKSFMKLKKYFKGLDKNIDFTSFLNKVIQNKIVKFKAVKTKKFWTEIDTENDIKAAVNMIKNFNK